MPKAGTLFVIVLIATVLVAPGRLSAQDARALFNLVLTDPPTPEARQAAQTLAEMGSAAAPLLVQALEDPRPLVRRRATYVLALFPEIDADIASALGRVLDDPERAVRINAALRLKSAGAAARPAAPGLIAALHDSDTVVRTHASRALMQIGRADPAVIPGLIQGLSYEKNPYAARQALIMLGPPASPALVTALADPEPLVREHVVDVLGKIRPVLSGVVPALIRTLERDAEGRVRGQAVSALADIGGASDEVLFALVRALAIDDEIVRERAAGTLGGFNRAEPAVLNGLVHALKDPGWGVRASAAHALAVMAPPDPHIIRALVDSLRDEYRPAMAAVDALARIGRPATTALQQAAKDADQRVRWRAEEALRTRARLDPNNLSAVLTLMQDAEADSRLRSRALNDLVRLGPQAQPAVPDLVRMLGDKDNEGRRLLAARALAGLLPRDRNTSAALTRSLSDPNTWVRMEAALALARIGPPPEARAALQKLAIDPPTEYLNTPGFLFELERALGTP